MNLLTRLIKAEKFGDEIKGDRVWVTKIKIKDKPYFIIDKNPNYYCKSLPSCEHDTPQLIPMPSYLKPFVKILLNEQFN